MPSVVVVAVVVSLLAVSVWRLRRRLRAQTLALAEREAALAAQRDELASLLQALPMPVWIARDRDCRVVEGNAAANALLGLDGGNAAAAYGTAYRSFRDGVEVAPEDLPMQVAGRTGRAVPDAEWEVELQDGRRFTLLVNAIPLFGADGSVTGVIAGGLDVTGRQRAERALRAASQELELVADAMPAPVTRCDRDYTYRWVSRPYAAWLRRSREEIRGRHIADVIGREAFERLKPYFDRVLAGEVVQYEERVQFAGAGERWVMATYTPTWDDDGRCDGWVAVVVDIDERKRMEEALGTSEARYRTLAEGMPFAMWEAGTDGRPHFTNRYWREYTGLTPEETTDGWMSAIHPDEVGALLARWHESLRTGAPVDRVQRIRRAADGTYRWFRMIAVPVHDAAGRITKWVGASIDVHDARTAEAALQEAARRKDEFLAMLGHELRNPLAAIRNAVATASLDGQHRATALAIARRQTEQVGRLVDDLLDVARITQGRINLRREPTALQTIVARAVEASQPSCDERGHTLAVDVEPGDLWVDADANRLEQVLVNLLSNACKYTNPSGRVSLTVRKDGSRAVVRVRDSGIGIAPDLLPHVFELFTQAERSLDRAQGGLGIGLTIAQRIVELHGGRLEAFSDGPGKGAEFVVALPLVAPVPLPAAPGAADAPARRASRVLMVEDNPDAAESMRLLLEVLGHQVRVAYDGPQALALAQANRPDVMLVDIGLPGMNGYEVARRIRRDPALRDVTLVALTGYGRDEDKTAAMNAGFDYHLVKPVDPENLERLIRGLGDREPRTRDTVH